MENHRDEHIVCADCGADFLFSAGEAAVFQERGLAAPKRCKDCRRARKDRVQGDAASSRGPRAPRSGGWNAGGHDAGPPRGPRDGARPRFAGGGGRGDAPRYGAPRYTGDVNEYRSPMQDGGWQQQQWQGNRAPAGGNGWQPARAPRRGGPGIYRHDGEYRAPSGHAEGNGFGHADRPRRPFNNGNGQQAAAAGPRRRPDTEMFSITCNSCGVQAEVPFKPAEGREVFCQACYRARKPPV
ncbi:MAG: zinc-ribbon domain containing protein [Minicystis sp.]